MFLYHPRIAHGFEFLEAHDSRYFLAVGIEGVEKAELHSLVIWGSLVVRFSPFLPEKGGTVETEG